MLRLYGSAKSRALRNLWLLGELDVPYDHKDYLPGSPETRTPEFRALNPNARIPVIDDDGFVLCESMAINLYLAKRHASSLYPCDAGNEALALQWSFWQTDRIDRQIVNYFMHSKVLPEAERKPEVAESCWKEVVEAFAVLEVAFGQGRVACRPLILDRRPERGRGAVPRAVPRSREVASSAGVAHAMLGAPGSEARARDAGVDHVHTGSIRRYDSGRSL